MFFEICIICAIIFALWLIGKLLMLFDIVHMPMKRVHIWRHVKHLNQACYCSICEIMLTSSGFYCEACGICSDTLCITTAEKVLKCKMTSTELQKIDKFEPVVREQPHQWIKGNLNQSYTCYICDRDVDYHGRPGLYGYRCCWCQRSTHVNCFVKTVDDKVCDFGTFKDMIIPPNHVFIKQRRLHRQITKVLQPDWPDWRPLIVVANSKSGDNTAENVIAVFRSVLNPIQIFELSSTGPAEALNLISKIRAVPCRILVAGGDGTIGWILNEITRKNIQPIPEVCILPVGTGNDLSRVLGWGGVPPPILNTVELCEKIRSAETIQLDRWLIDIGQSSRRLHINWLPHRKLNMYNYFSVGVDAQVTLNFHKARESPFYMTSSRIFNKILYLCFGTHQVVLPDCVGLEKKIEVYLDGKKIELPEVQAVVCLNIDSWGAGVNLWVMSGDENGPKIKSSISDGVIEVLGIVSSFHMAQLQVGLNKPIRLGQARNVRIQMHETFPVQADGEPWIQAPSEINISCNGQAKMLQCSS